MLIFTVEIVHRRHRFVCLQEVYGLVQIYALKIIVVLPLVVFDRNEFRRHVRKAAFDALITSGMTVRSCNESVLNGHVECTTFSELSNGDMGKLTSVANRR
jgi:hypothetical protein